METTPTQQASQEAIDTFLLTVKPSEFWQEGPENREPEDDLEVMMRRVQISFVKGDTIDCKNTCDNKGCRVPDDEYKVLKVKEKYLVLMGMNTGVRFRGDRTAFENMSNTSLM
jgi:hypothetical protein